MTKQNDCVRIQQNRMIGEEIIMTREEFYHKMLALEEQYGSDQEKFHIEADTLICDLLIELGYGQGVEIFLDTPVWYA